MGESGQVIPAAFMGSDRGVQSGSKLCDDSFRSEEVRR